MSQLSAQQMLTVLATGTLNLLLRPALSNTWVLQRIHLPRQTEPQDRTTAQQHLSPGAATDVAALMRACWFSSCVLENSLSPLISSYCPAPSCWQTPLEARLCTGEGVKEISA